MRALLEEYGKVIISVIIGMALLSVVVVGVRTWYENEYPELQQSNVILADTPIEYPVLEVESIEIRAGEMEVHDLLEYVTAYENSDSYIEIPVTIVGAESIDSTTKGIYQILYEATNSIGLTISEKATVLIY